MNNLPSLAPGFIAQKRVKFERPVSGEEILKAMIRITKGSLRKETVNEKDKTFFNLSTVSAKEAELFEVRADTAVKGIDPSANYNSVLLYSRHAWSSLVAQKDVCEVYELIAMRLGDLFWRYEGG